MNLLFYNTLFDENAACHFALGRGYSECVRGGEAMEEAALLEAGVNQSLVHVDFMVSTARPAHRGNPEGRQPRARV